jgi:TIR domain
MVPAEELELKIFRFAELAGKARWRPADLGTLANFLQFVEQPVLVDALDDLYARRFVEFRQWSYAQNDWVLYAGNREYFSYPFEMRVTFPGRKYFEGLDAQSSKPTSPEKKPEIRLKGISKGNATVTAKLDASPQVIAASAATPPKAFVSHSGQDRHFVERFAADLWGFGVMAWYSRWEIKAGDSIPAKIDEGIEDCEFFIIVLSKHSLHAAWVQTELQAAISRRAKGKIRKIIPIFIDDCGDVPPMLDTLYRVNFANQPYEAALDEVVNSVLDVDLRPPLGNGRNEQKKRA